METHIENPKSFQPLEGSLNTQFSIPKFLAFLRALRLQYGAETDLNNFILHFSVISNSKSCSERALKLRQKTARASLRFEDHSEPSYAAVSGKLDRPQVQLQFHS